MNFTKVKTYGKSDNFKIFLYRETLYIKKIIVLLKDEKILIFFDESTFRPNRTTLSKWCKKKNPPRIFVDKNLEKFNLLLSISEFNYTHQKTTSCNTNTDGVKQYLKEICQILKSSIVFKEIYKQKQIYFVLDNASYHRNIRIKK